MAGLGAVWLHTCNAIYCMLMAHVLWLRISHKHEPVEVHLNTMGDLSVFTALTIGRAHSGSLPHSVSCSRAVGPEPVFSRYTAVSTTRKPPTAVKRFPSVHSPAIYERQPPPGPPLHTNFPKRPGPGRAKFGNTTYYMKSIMGENKLHWELSS